MTGLIFGWVLKVLSAKSVDKVLAYLKADAARQTGEAKIKSEITIAQIQAGVTQTQIMADLNKAKFDHAPYWIFAGLFVVPLGLWWTAVILDSVFLLGWGVDTVPILEDWGGEMIRWLFYTGGAAMALKALR
jgi:hypothetical protein